jgi:SAM-dependent methyltransferase
MMQSFSRRNHRVASGILLAMSRPMTTISQTPNHPPDFFPSAPAQRSLRLRDDRVGSIPAETQSAQRGHRVLLAGLVDGLKRRWQRELRRRKVGRAYDMALEIARLLPLGAGVLDIGCGNGFIAHHLSAMLGRSTIGIDLGQTAAAPIDYRQYDGTRFPVPTDSFDAVLLCYVLHHAEDVSVVLDEVRRVLRTGGLAVIYEDMPLTFWDKGVCWIHNRQWRGRTGPCTFRRATEWSELFNSMGFEVLGERSLSRWRNLAHPVCRKSYLLKMNSSSSPLSSSCRRFD